MHMLLVIVGGLALLGVFTLFGWLWLRGEKDRISELFELIISEEN